MSTLTSYNGLQVATPSPTGDGGLAINNNFKALSTHVSTLNPTVGNDSTQSFAVGSRWYNRSTTVEWICLDATAGAAVWTAVASGALAGYLPLSGGTVQNANTGPSMPILGVASTSATGQAVLGLAVNGTTVHFIDLGALHRNLGGHKWITQAELISSCFVFSSSFAS
jgi:hypothetical protein